MCRQFCGVLWQERQGGVLAGIFHKRAGTRTLKITELGGFVASYSAILRVPGTTTAPQHLKTSLTKWELVCDSAASWLRPQNRLMSAKKNTTGPPFPGEGLACDPQIAMGEGSYGEPSWGWCFGIGCCWLNKLDLLRPIQNPHAENLTSCSMLQMGDLGILLTLLFCLLMCLPSVNVIGPASQARGCLVYAGGMACLTRCLFQLQ